jgi:hypothetical protein
MKQFIVVLKLNLIVGQSFLELQRMPTNSDELLDQFVRNGECQKVLAQNGDILLSKKLHFILQTNLI